MWGQQPGSPREEGALALASYGALASYCRWETRALAPCPVTCGGGRLPLAVRCVRLDRGRLVPLPHSKCWLLPRPRPVEVCSPEPCPARWATSQGDVVSSPSSKLLSLGVLTRRSGSHWGPGRLGGLEHVVSHGIWDAVNMADGSFVITCSLLSTRCPRCCSGGRGPAGSRTEEHPSWRGHRGRGLGEGDRVGQVVLV